MTSITLICQGGLARARVEGTITQGMVGIPVTVQWDEAWEGLQKTLKVRCAEVVRRVAVWGAEPVSLPFECLIAGQRLECGLDGWDNDGKLRIPTNWVSCGVVKPSVAECDGMEGAQPTPPVAEQIMARVEQVQDDLIGVVPFFFGAAPDLNRPFLLFETKVPWNEAVNLCLSQSEDEPVSIDIGDESFGVSNMVETSVDEYTIL